MSLLARDSQDAIEGDAMCVYVHPRAGRRTGVLLASSGSPAIFDAC